MLPESGRGSTSQRVVPHLYLAKAGTLFERPLFWSVTLTQFVAECDLRRTRDNASHKSEMEELFCEMRMTWYSIDVIR